MANRLDREASPYLRKHADQAIDWHPWGQEAFAAARRADKPILVSIGYLACFWCHVMAEESFSDPRVTLILDRDFVAIKVDREERPDVDRSVLDSLARLGARTGWPVTAFMTADGEVFAGGSYYPPEPRHGLPGFTEVLADALTKYADRGRDGGGASDFATARSKEAAPRERSAVADVESYATFLGDRLLENVDRIYGGFGRTGPRFPQISAHELLWRRYMTSGTRAFGDATRESMSRICRSALYDHVGGGFHRYCVDDAWTVPHFEKMLYDNAQLVEHLTWLWRATRDPLFADQAKRTVEWAIREMLIEERGFASSLGAHAEDSLSETAGSGLFYRWDKTEIREALEDDASSFLKAYEVCPMGDQASGALRRTETELSADQRLHVVDCLARLLERRSGRRRPQRDDKVMADWNGLMIVALVEAGTAFGRRDWLALAMRVFDILVDRLSDGKRLRHCITDRAIGPDGFLEDYAMMSRAALRLFEAFGKQRYVEIARGWIDVLDDTFWDKTRGGYFMSSDNDWQPMPRTRTIAETSLPSGNGVMIGVLARLHELTGEGRYADRAERLIEGFHGDLSRYGVATATAINNVTTLGRFVRITVSGRPDEDATRYLLGAALDCALPDRMVLGPGSGAGDENAKASAQVCVGTICLLPVTSADALRELLAPGGLRSAEHRSAGSSV